MYPELSPDLHAAFPEPKQPVGRQASATHTTRLVLALLLALLAPLRLTAIEGESQGLMIWDFEQGVTNRWGGKYNVYFRDPSWARTYLDRSAGLRAGGHSLRVTVHRDSRGFCGVWLKFYPDSSANRRFLDASSYRYLSFWTKGEKGGEDFELRLVDEAGEQKEDSTPPRPLRRYLPAGLDNNWRQVVIPLEDFSGLDLHRLTQVTLNFVKTGDYRFYVGDLLLSHDRPSQSPDFGPAASQTPGSESRETSRAMWVWNTHQLFDEPHRADEMEKFFRFCSLADLREIYLSLDLKERRDAAGVRFDLFNPRAYREFLERAHKEGIRVEGLAGTPEWAIGENHPLALAAVEALVRFNRGSPPAGRFDGVHFDVEPYLLVEYADPLYRSELLSDFLRMVERCAERVRAESPLRFSCDVPAWFYPTDVRTQQELKVNFHGREKAVGEHLTDLLDEVTIMDYRNEADGAGGIIAFGSAALAYAASQGKKIIVGLETSYEPESRVYFVWGLPLEEFHRRLAASELRRKFYLGKYRLAAFRHQTRIHVGLRAPARLEGATRDDFTRSLGVLAEQLGAASDPERFPVQPMLEETRPAFLQNPEWNGFETFQLTDPGTHRVITGFRAFYRMPRYTTFQDLGHEVFTEEVRSVREWLSRYSSFAGLAFHHYETVRDLIEGR